MGDALTESQRKEVTGLLEDWLASGQPLYALTGHLLCRGTRPVAVQVSGTLRIVNERVVVWAKRGFVHVPALTDATSIRILRGPNGVEVDIKYGPATVLLLSDHGFISTKGGPVASA